MPFDSKEKRRNYARKWRKNNREHHLNYVRAYIKRNRKRIRIYLAKHLKENPWLRSYWAAKQRCTDKNSVGYKKYGGRGIKFLLKIQDVKKLWERDNANLLIRPSIDRINNDGNYVFLNCRFIEFKENAKKRAFNSPRNNKGMFV